MATPRKKRDVEEMEIQSSDDDDQEIENDDLEESSSDSEEDDLNMSEEVQVDFEAMPPCDSDYDGIRNLLNQLFLKSNINISQMTEAIISQSYVGCVIKQGEVPEEDDSDEEVEEDPVFGVITVINMSEKKDLSCVKELKQLMLKNCEKSASEKLPELKQLLDDSSSKQIGFLLHERFINIPSSISVPMYESLKKDLESEKVKKMKYKFDDYIFICKTCRPVSTVKSSTFDMKDVIFLNPEEEFLLQSAKFHFTYSVAAQRDSIVDGKWKDELESLRTVIVVDSQKLDDAVAAMKSAIEKS